MPHRKPERIYGKTAIMNKKVQQDCRILKATHKIIGIAACHNAFFKWKGKMIDTKFPITTKTVTDIDLI